MVGEARPSPAYYIALGLLVVGLVTGLSLFLLLATRPHSSSASVEVEYVSGTQCGGVHGTSCFRFDVRNTSGGPAVATCQVIAASGTTATFADGSKVTPVTLLEGQVREILTSVVADPGADIAQPTDIAQPSLSCSATPV
jgi:hypothetical protein